MSLARRVLCFGVGLVAWVVVMRNPEAKLWLVLVSGFGATVLAMDVLLEVHLWSRKSNR